MNIKNCIFLIFFEYSTVKYLSIDCKIIGIINRILYLIIGLYIFGYVLLYSKGYQEIGDVESVVTTKVKGVSRTNYSKEDFQIPESRIHLYNRVWDVSEYVVPATEKDTFFILTNAVITPNQTYGVCDEDPNVENALCGKGLPPCKPGYSYELGNGIATGKCINSTQRAGAKVCEIEAWCPIEFDIFPLKNSRALLDDAKNHTVLIKNRIHFPKFGSEYKRSNLLMNADNKYLRSCSYDEEKDPFCPTFQINDIVESAGQNFTEIALKGAVISIQIVWNCNLDLNFMENCVPKYSFQRIDNTNTNAALGWDFRHAFHHEFDRRTLMKVYGIKFVIDVRGQAGKFHFIPTLFNVGAGMGLLGLASLLSDFIMLTCLKSKDRIEKCKFVRLPGDEPYLGKKRDYTEVEVVV